MEKGEIFLSIPRNPVEIVKDKHPNKDKDKEKEKEKEKFKTFIEQREQERKR